MTVRFGRKSYSLSKNLAVIAHADWSAHQTQNASARSSENKSPKEFRERVTAAFILQ